MVPSFSCPSGCKVYLARGATDMRKSINGLAGMVVHFFRLDPQSPCLFVFCNRDKDKLKILYWENNGFWLLYRRLDRGRFRWPAKGELGEAPLHIDGRQLSWLLEGLDIEQAKAHRPLQSLPAPPSSLLPRSVLNILDSKN